MREGHPILCLQQLAVLLVGIHCAVREQHTQSRFELPFFDTPELPTSQLCILPSFTSFFLVCEWWSAVILFAWMLCFKLPIDYLIAVLFYNCKLMLLLPFCKTQEPSRFRTIWWVLLEYWLKWAGIIELKPQITNCCPFINLLSGFCVLSYSVLFGEYYQNADSCGLE